VNFQFSQEAYKLNSLRDNENPKRFPGFTKTKFVNFQFSQEAYKLNSLRDNENPKRFPTQKQNL
jgi:hypothetical protein